MDTPVSPYKMGVTYLWCSNDWHGIVPFQISEDLEGWNNYTAGQSKPEPFDLAAAG